MNCSRVGLTGGLKTFSDELMCAMVQAGMHCRAILPAGYAPPTGVEPIFTPASLAGGADLSLLRPLKWLAYSHLNFPVSADEKVLATTHQVLPRQSNQIVTVHDLRPYFYPDTPIQKFYFHHMLPRALSRCDGILTVSESSRALIGETYGISLDRITVVPNSVQFPAERSMHIRSDGPEYLLVVGASWSHKNIESLLVQHRLWADTYQLKIVGGEGPYQTQLKTIVSSIGIIDRVQFLSGVSGEELDRYYRECAALVYPSKMEGFGLPPLEAMVRRRPAIVSDIPVFRELYGYHALFVELDSEDSWGEAFLRLSHLDGGYFDGAQEHARSYSRKRMGNALGAALERFWSLDTNLKCWGGPPE